ncbi:hypothetical protein D9Q98_010151 [Chlorella vulgaris]|uniref:Uncharacterized protein n=1 Tax=Chlorella vulgaris TaxID=3077 RepID=A0A9D4TMZ5_CHLVU|nr:hypothetical protein D9Q98_010151 [Chlorella vulgaris]
MRCQPSPYIVRANYESNRQRGTGMGQGQQQQQRNLPVPVAPPPPPPPLPPPPPPPPSQQPPAISKRNLVAGGVLAGALLVGIQLSKGMLTRMRPSRDEAELAAAAARLGIGTTPRPKVQITLDGTVVPIFDEATQRVKALSVLGEDGRQFVVTVDPKLPSRLLVQDRSTSKLYVLQTRVDSVNINNPLAMTKLFQSGWEQKLRPLQ